MLASSLACSNKWGAPSEKSPAFRMWTPASQPANHLQIDRSLHLSICLGRSLASYSSACWDLFWLTSANNNEKALTKQLLTLGSKTHDDDNNNNNKNNDGLDGDDDDDAIFAPFVWRATLDLARSWQGLPNRMGFLPFFLAL